MIEEIKKRIMPGRVINIGMETTQQDSNYILWLYREHERLSSRLERYETTLQKITHTTTHMQAKFFAQEALRE